MNDFKNLTADEKKQNTILIEELKRRLDDKGDCQNG
jgi:hypothetical protein